MSECGPDCTHEDMPKRYAPDEMPDKIGVDIPPPPNKVTVARTSMEIINEKPPIWDLAKEHFAFNPDATFFTWGNKLFNPAKIDPVPMDIIKHEEVHAAQQNHNEEGAKVWWARYMQEPLFRVDQEARAFGVQYKYLCTVNKDRNAQARILHAIACLLSGPTYGNAISHSAARDFIKQYSK